MEVAVEFNDQGTKSTVCESRTRSMRVVDHAWGAQQRWNVPGHALHDILGPDDACAIITTWSLVNVVAGAWLLHEMAKEFKKAVCLLQKAKVFIKTR